MISMLYDDSMLGFHFVLTPEDARRTEQKAFDLGVPSLLLMEHAAIAVVDELEKTLGGCSGRRVLFLCGTGNNGGDGLAAARLFQMRGGFAEVWLSGGPKTPDANTQLKWAQALGIEITNLREACGDDFPLEYCDTPKKCYDAYVDAVLGTGFRGVPDEITERMIMAPRHDREIPIKGEKPVIAVDIPSGIDGKTGNTPGAFMYADVTVTFNAPKPGLYLTQEREAVGKIVIADIGLWHMMPWNSDALLLDEPELKCEMLTPKALRLMEKRQLNAHKGDCGRVLIYAGKEGMAGAAAMCAKAAVTAGAGLVTVACEKEILPILQTLVPNAMCMEIAQAVKRSPAYDVFAVGCGLGQEETIWQNILALWNPEKKSVWDADALNLLAKHGMKLGSNAVMTPHPGEAARLLNKPTEEILSDRIHAARELAQRYGCTAVLKSDVSVLCSIEEEGPAFMLNTVGTPALAKGGSGDALTGILSALLPYDLPLYSAATACLWHGLAGLSGEKKYGQRELTTDQLISCLWDAERNAVTE
ncbi:MAG: NAD(P)H-hydrate dehydratase [Clostridia bacterium]|nr:NAD(P)H-hydrate dehydratase [Clostridia bacterium]